MSRDTKLSSPTRVVNGPDAALTGFGSIDFKFETCIGFMIHLQSAVWAFLLLLQSLGIGRRR